jgi:hypothetical protein
MNTPDLLPLKLYVQKQNTVVMKGLFRKLTDYLTIPIDQFYSDYFNLLTCTTQKLDNWGRILNQTRNITFYNYQYILGFDVDEPAPVDNEYPQNFDHGNFFAFNGIPGLLNDNEFRVILQFAYFRQTIDCSIGACVAITNFYAKQSGSDHKCQIIEGDMSFIYNFNYTLQGFEIVLFKQNKILPTPAGITYDVNWVA